MKNHNLMAPKLRLDEVLLIRKIDNLASYSSLKTKSVLKVFITICLSLI